MEPGLVSRSQESMSNVGRNAGDRSFPIRETRVSVVNGVMWNVVCMLGCGKR